MENDGTSSASNVASVGNNGYASATNFNTRAESVPSAEPASKRKFSLKDHVEIGDASLSQMDEVTSYKSSSISSMGLSHDIFFDNPFSIVEFWHARKKSFPALYIVAMCVYATLPSSCASERVFTTVSKIISADRSSTSPELLGDIIVARSLVAKI